MGPPSLQGRDSPSPVQMPLFQDPFLQSPAWPNHCWFISPSGASQVKSESGLASTKQGELEERGRPLQAGRRRLNKWRELKNEACREGQVIPALVHQILGLYGGFSWVQSSTPSRCSHPHRHCLKAVSLAQPLEGGGRQAECVFQGQGWR